MTAYFQDVAVLARKDILLELRSRETVPAMLLFVVGALTIFHYALPGSAGDDAARGLLWIAILFTALLGLSRAFVSEREQGVLDGLVLAPCDRSAIWLAKSLSVLGFLVVAGGEQEPVDQSLLTLGNERARQAEKRGEDDRHPQQPLRG